MANGHWISSRNITIAASAALCMVLGSIHAFSVFTPQWEDIPNADRASVSLVYSTALVALTLAVLFGYRVYNRLPPVAVFLIVGLLASLGLTLSAHSSSLINLYLTYGLLFGGANGLGYGYALQLAGQSTTSHRGLAMGLVTAFYAVGATASPPLFVFLISRGGNTLALQTISAVVLFVSIMAAVMLIWSKARYQSTPTSTMHALSPILKRARILIWVAYGSAVTAGLMVIGHSFGIATWLGLDSTSATLATTAVAFGSMLGGFSAGYYADRSSSKTLLLWLPLLSSIGLLLLALPVSLPQVIVFMAVSLVGYCYGAIIAVYPVAVADIYGGLIAPKIYGQIFTAWGLAGLLGPWISGWFFVKTSSYTAPLLIAAFLCTISIVAIRKCLPKNYIWKKLT